MCTVTIAASLSWALTEQTLKKINSKEKHVLRIIFNNGKFENTSELFKSSKILTKNIKLNIFNTAVFMNKIQGKSVVGNGVN